LEERITSIIRVTRIGKLERTLAVISLPILVTLMMEAIHSFETSVLTRTAWHNIQEDGVLHSNHHENFKSYTDKSNS
jgi:hypothetical protein